MSEETKSSAIGIGLAAALGGLAAVMIDLFQKKDASAIYQLTSFVNKMSLSFDPTGQFALPVVGVGLLLLIFSIILAFMVEARSGKAAFYSGASVLTVLMTLVPYQQPLAPESGVTVRQMSSREDWREVGVIPATFTGGGTFAIQNGLVVPVQAQTTIPVVVTVHAEGADPSRISGVLYDAVSGRSYQLGYGTPARTDKTGSTFQFEFAIATGEPKGERIADLKLRVAAPGYRVATTGRTVTSLGERVEMSVDLTPSNIPQFLQRAIERPQY